MQFEDKMVIISFAKFATEIQVKEFNFANTSSVEFLGRTQLRQDNLERALFAFGATAKRQGGRGGLQFFLNSFGKNRAIFEDGETAALLTKIKKFVATFVWDK